MLVDYYLLKTQRPMLTITCQKGTLPATPLTGWSAIFAWICGSLIGLTITFGVPALNSLLASSLLYGCMNIFNKKR